MSTLSRWFSLAVATAACLSHAPAAFADPGTEAIAEFGTTKGPLPAIENRFFLKKDRFEIAPMFGYVPNNPFATRIGGGVLVGYHFNEEFSAQGVVSYSPDLGESDIKGLTEALVIIAHTGPGGSTFQQPLDKVTLSAAFGGAWAPFYGKINLVGETVVNFDFYLDAGIGIVSKVNYFAVYDSNAPSGTVPVQLVKAGNEVEVAPNLGLGANFFINQTIAVKLDARFEVYVDNQPQYDQTTPVTKQRLYAPFVASAGVGFFFPKMKPRLYEF